MVIKEGVISEIPINYFKKLSYTIWIFARKGSGHNVTMHCDCLNTNFTKVVFRRLRFERNNVLSLKMQIRSN
ncbi:hypothetical protein HanRHA438_Chr04g0164171 [Helianthus annuus]|nr:hypothetical protein HanRHA438_Chr04g0164171 [Helianthus annuus]